MATIPRERRRFSDRYPKITGARRPESVAVHPDRAPLWAVRRLPLRAKKLNYGGDYNVPLLDAPPQAVRGEAAPSLSAGPAMFGRRETAMRPASGLPRADANLTASARTGPADSLDDVEEELERIMAELRAGHDETGPQADRRAWAEGILAGAADGPLIRGSGPSLEDMQRHNHQAFGGGRGFVVDPATGNIMGPGPRIGGGPEMPPEPSLTSAVPFDQRQAVAQKNLERRQRARALQRYESEPAMVTTGYLPDMMTEGGAAVEEGGTYGGPDSVRLRDEMFVPGAGWVPVPAGADDQQAAVARLQGRALPDDDTMRARNEAWRAGREKELRGRRQRRLLAGMGYSEVPTPFENAGEPTQFAHAGRPASALSPKARARLQRMGRLPAEGGVPPQLFQMALAGNPQAMQMLGMMQQGNLALAGMNNQREIAQMQAAGLGEARNAQAGLARAQTENMGKLTQRDEAMMAHDEKIEGLKAERAVALQRGDHEQAATLLDKQFAAEREKMETRFKQDKELAADMRKYTSEEEAKKRQFQGSLEKQRMASEERRSRLAAATDERREKRAAQEADLAALLQATELGITPRAVARERVEDLTSGGAPRRDLEMSPAASALAGTSTPPDIETLPDEAAIDAIDSYMENAIASGATDEEAIADLRDRGFPPRLLNAWLQAALADKPWFPSKDYIRTLDIASGGLGRETPTGYGGIIPLQREAAERAANPPRKNLGFTPHTPGSFSRRFDKRNREYIKRLIKGGL